MTERRPERYRWSADMDRSTAGDRIPIWRRHEFADGVSVGVNDSEVHLPPRPRRPTGFELALERRAAYWERQRRRHVIGWTIFLLGVVPVLGALLMVAVVTR